MILDTNTSYNNDETKINLIVNVLTELYRENIMKKKAKMEKKMNRLGSCDFEKLLCFIIAKSVF